MPNQDLALPDAYVALGTAEGIEHENLMAVMLIQLNQALEIEDAGAMHARIEQIFEAEDVITLSLQEHVKTGAYARMGYSSKLEAQTRADKFLQAIHTPNGRNMWGSIIRDVGEFVDRTQDVQEYKNPFEKAADLYGVALPRFASYPISKIFAVFGSGEHIDTLKNRTRSFLKIAESFTRFMDYGDAVGGKPRVDTSGTDPDNDLA